ncbi:Uncharacterized protein Adt_38096 [Abeliophyllum distichum]|uniref:Uncharacterized protein n=1 Tax=Abeliophyllum distichum TaxID=126358 RepID=A0ABD1Q1G3_9LAMI
MCLHLGEGGVSGRVYLSVVTARLVSPVEKIENAQRKVRCGSDRSTTDRCSGRRQWSVDHCSSGRVVDHQQRFDRCSGRPTACGRPQQRSTTAAVVDHQQRFDRCSGRPTACGRPLLGSHQQWSTTAGGAVVDPLLESTTRSLEQCRPLR